MLGMQDEGGSALDVQDDHVLAGHGGDGDRRAGRGALARHDDGVLDPARAPARVGRPRRHAGALAAWHQERDGRRKPAGYRCHSFA